jgi:hypothetical protein
MSAPSFGGRIHYSTLSTALQYLFAIFLKFVKVAQGKPLLYSRYVVAFVQLAQ